MTTVTMNLISEPSYQGPGMVDWEPLCFSGAQEDLNDEETKQIRDKVARANETLKAALLNSLQMQHLVVLAGSGCSFHAGGPSMGDLWEDIVTGNQSQAQSIADKIKYDIKTKNIESFLSQIESADFLQDKEIDDFLDMAKERILSKMSSFLLSNKREQLSAHEILLHRLSRRRTRDQRLRLFTTNYDLCFERAAINIGCVAIDGFSFMAPRRYDPRFFDYDIIRRLHSGDDNGNYLEGVFLLYKLHGSVNWEKTDDGVLEKENPNPQKACIIYPASGKYQQSYNQPYIESISQYLSAVREPNTCVLIMGFGFNDDHLSEPLLSAARSNPHLRIWVVDPCAKQNSRAIANRYLKELYELSLKGEDIWFINETFEEFAKRIPDLKSLTPAERLLKDIEGVVHQS